ncbi:MAG TPA: hypothetical protein VIL46_08800, partial [Gemmataceae bacterium]
FCPFGPPFVYEMGGGFYPKDPPAFSLLAAPLYAALGWRGLYLLPLVSLWVVWWRADAVCRGLRLSPAAHALTLAALVFGTPLLFYSATFWGHLPAVAVAFAGLSLLLVRPVCPASREGPEDSEAPLGSRGIPGPGPPAPLAGAASRPTPGTSGPARLAGHAQEAGRGVVRTAAAGLLIGASVWLRSDLLALPATLVLMLGSARFRGWVGRPGLFAAAMILPVLGLLAFNQAAVGYPLGVHAFQAVDTTPGERVISAAWAFGWNARTLAITCPSVVVAAFGCLLLWRNPGLRGRLPRGLWVAAVTGLAFAAVVAAILPTRDLFGTGGKQFGPRFLLPTILLLTLLTGPLYELAGRAPALRSLRLYLPAGLVCAVVVNTPYAWWHLRADYAGRIRPGLEAVRARPEPVVAVPTQFVAQDLEALIPQKHVLWVRDAVRLEELVERCAQKGYGAVLFVRDAEDFHFPHPELLGVPPGFADRWTDLGRFGSLRLASVETSPPRTAIPRAAASAAPVRRTP